MVKHNKQVSNNSSELKVKCFMRNEESYNNPVVLKRRLFIEFQMCC